MTQWQDQRSASLRHHALLSFVFLYALVTSGLALALAWIVPTIDFANPSTPEGQFFLTHTSGFAPLYAFLSEQGAAEGVRLLLYGSAGYTAVAVVYALLFSRLQPAPAFVSLLWRSWLQWLVLGCVWGGLLLAYPLLSDDSIYYLVHARLAWHYGLNPYVTESGRVLASDMWQRVLGTPQPIPYMYGPVWLALSLPAVMVAGSSLSLALIGLKLLNAVLVALCALVLWHLLADCGAHRRRLATLALVWNPLILLELIWNSHNDTAMILWILLALLAFKHARHTLALCLILLGVATKYIPVLLVPLLVAAMLRGDQQWIRALPRLGRTIGIGCAVLALFYVPMLWKYGLAVFSGLATMAAMLRPSVGSLIEFYGSPVVGASVAKLFVLSILISVTLICTLRVWRGSSTIDMSLIVMTAYILVLSTSLMPWYSVSLIMLGLVAHARLGNGIVLGTLIMPSYYLINVVAVPPILQVLLMAGVPLLMIYGQWYSPQRRSASLVGT